MKRLLFIFLFLVNTGSVFNQVLLREDDELLDKLQECLYAIYKNDFQTADRSIAWVENKTGDHPVVPFLKGLRIYWSYNPLTPESREVKKFITYMETCIIGSDSILKIRPNDLEGTFFSLVSRAMLMLYYADNEMSYKVISYANEAYKLMRAAFKLKDEFNEFYFVSGLYKYYRVAYPEAHPVYKPLLVVFKQGNKEEGIKEIKYAIQNAIYLRVEAKLYLSYIYLHYEVDAEQALVLAKELYEEFPENPYFLARYTEILLLTNRYTEAIPLVGKLLDSEKNDFYSKMKGIVFKALIEEKKNIDLEKAKRDYEMGLQLAESYASWGLSYKCYALLGLSRIAKDEGDLNKHREYNKWVKKNAPYSYINLWD